MRNFLNILGALLFSCAVTTTSFGTTLNPVQLLNPTGSSSGQAIVSTGASSAPGWANVSATSLAAQAANTVVANVTGSSASPTAFAMPSCSTSASALNWTSGTGFTCNASINAATLGGTTFAAPGPIGSTTASTGAFTTLSASSTVSGAGFTTLLSPYAPLASPTFTGTVTTAALTATGLISPSSTNGIKGTATNDNANAGSIGEYLTASVTTNTSMSLATATNLCSVSLTAGDWDVTGNAYYIAGSTNITQMVTSINTVSATSAGAPFQVQQALTIPSGSVWTQSPMVTRVSLSSSGTAYLVGFVNGTGNPTYQCIIRARRVR